MKTKNNVQLIGYVGKDPVIRTTATGRKCIYIRVATDRFFKSPNGKTIKNTAWHDVIAWEKKAETAANDFIKGSHILVEGPIVYRTYEDITGHTRYVTEIKAESLMNLDR